MTTTMYIKSDIKINGAPKTREKISVRGVKYTIDNSTKSSPTIFETAASTINVFEEICILFIICFPCVIRVRRNVAVCTEA